MPCDITRLEPVFVMCGAVVGEITAAGRGAIATHIDVADADTIAYAGLAIQRGLRSEPNGWAT